MGTPAIPAHLVMIFPLRKRPVLVHVLQQVRHHFLYLLGGDHVPNDQHAHLADLVGDALGQLSVVVGDPLEAGDGNHVRPVLRERPQVLRQSPLHFPATEGWIAIRCSMMRCQGNAYLKALSAASWSKPMSALRLTCS